MMYVIVQIIAGFCAFMGLGQSLGKEATKFDKIAGNVICFLFLAFILYIEEVYR